MGFWRETMVIGINRANSTFPHRSDCVCESCGPLYLLALSGYEIKRLQEALETREGRDTGDWHGQIRYKLADALGPWNPSE